MWIIAAAMKRPITVVAAVLSIVLVAVMAITSMKRDILPHIAKIRRDQANSGRALLP